MTLSYPPMGSLRREALGALLGYATGFGVGALYGLLRAGPLDCLRRPIAAAGIAATATASTVAPYSALGVSDSRTWPAKSWAADIIPHLCYGWATAGPSTHCSAQWQARCSLPLLPCI